MEMQFDQRKSNLILPVHVAGVPAIIDHGRKGCKPSCRLCRSNIFKPFLIRKKLLAFQTPYRMSPPGRVSDGTRMDLQFSYSDS